MKKVCLISYIAPYAIPYIKTYLDIFKANNIKIDVVYWDRDGIIEYNDSENIRYYSYVGLTSMNDSKIIRYAHYIPATRFIYRFLKKKNYNGIVFLQTHAAIACLPIIIKKYLNKYIVDIRDYTLENFSFYRAIEKRVISNAYATVISSPGYRAFLPENNYVVAHNYTKVPEDVLENFIKGRRLNRPINISFIGYVRFYEMSRKLLLLFKNDPRFHLSFIGTGARVLKKFCQKNRITNVTLIDTFDPQETIDYYKECDVINNLYGNNNNFLDYALSNKIYYAAQFNIPILVSKNTYSSEVAKKYGFGIEIDPDDPKEADRLYKKLMELNRDDIKKGADEFLKIVERDNQVFKNLINNFIK